MRRRAGTLERGVARPGKRPIKPGITTLEPEPTASIVELVPRPERQFSPERYALRENIPPRPNESDPAVMLGLVTLVVACTLLAAVAVALLWLAG